MAKIRNRYNQAPHMTGFQWDSHNFTIRHRKREPRGKDTKKLYLKLAFNLRQPPSWQFIPVKHLKINCKWYTFGYLLLLSRCTPNYTITCSLYMLITLKHWKLVEKFVKKIMVKNKLINWIDICCRCTLELPQFGNSNVHQQHMLLKFRKHILKYTLNKYHVHWLCIFQTSQTANQS